MNTVTRLAPKPSAAMMPGAYLQMRRLASGRTIADVAAMLGYVHGQPSATIAAVADLHGELRRLEADHPLRDLALVSRLSGAFRFDCAVYDALVSIAADPDSAVLPRPDICRGCGCTWFDPCGHQQLGQCAWAETPAGAAPLCTHCDLVRAANDA